MQPAQPPPSGLSSAASAHRGEASENIHRIGAAIQSDYLQSREEAMAALEADAGFYRWTGKDPSAVRYMRSAMSPSEGIKIDPCDPMQRVIKILMDTPLLQRSDDISQLSTAALVFRDGNHTRFGHSVGSALLTAQLLRTIAHRSSGLIKSQIEEWGPTVVAFAMLHDGGHIAPGSHVAHSVWFPGQPDSHEAMSHMIIEEDPGLRVYLERALGTAGYSNLCKIIHEPEDNPAIPRWTWQIITAGGFNTDRGDWVRRDSEQCGVHYGRYDLMPIEKGLLITEAGDLALRENAVPTLKAFFDKRADMYLNVYNYDGCRVGGQTLVLIGQRARELYTSGKLNYADETMQCVLSAKSGFQLALPVVLNMTESWWRGHVNEWSKSEDGPLSTLCKTLKQRKLFRIVRKNGEDDDANRQELLSRVRSCGLDERYFFMDMPSAEVNLAKDFEKAIKVVTAKGHVKELPECNEVLRALEEIGKLRRPGFFAVARSVFGQAPDRLH